MSTDVNQVIQLKEQLTQLVAACLQRRLPTPPELYARHEAQRAALEAEQACEVDAYYLAQIVALQKKLEAASAPLDPLMDDIDPATDPKDDSWKAGLDQ